MAQKRKTSPWRGIENEDDGVNVVQGVRDPVRILPARDDVFVMVRQGQTLLEVATQAFGEPLLWWIIADLNQIDDPMRVTEGTELRVPTQARAIAINERRRRQRAP